MPRRHTRPSPDQPNVSISLLNMLGQRFGDGPFTFAQCHESGCSPAHLVRLQDELRVALHYGLIVSDVSINGVRGYRLAQDTWSTVQRRLARIAKRREGALAARRAHEPRFESIHIREAIALLEAHGYRVSRPNAAPDGEVPVDG